MASIFFIPPEFYGTHGLARGLHGVAGAIENRRERKQEEEDRELARLQRQFEVALRLGGVEAANAFLVQNPKLAQAVDKPIVPVEEQLSRRISEQTGSQRDSSLGVETRTSEQIDVANQADAERRLNEALASELTILQEIVSMNPAQSDAAYSRASKRLRDRLGADFKIQLTPEQIRRIHTSNLQPGTPDWNTEIFGHPDGLAGLTERARTQDEAADAEIELTRARTATERAQASALRVPKQAETLAQRMLKNEVDNLSRHGVGYYTIQTMLTNPAALTPEQLTEIQAARAKMQGQGQVALEPVFDLITKITEGKAPIEFDSAEEASSYARIYLGDYGTMYRVVKDDGLLGDKYRLELTGLTNDPERVTWTAPAGQAVEAEASLDKAGGVRTQVIGILQQAGIKGPSAEAIADGIIREHGVEGAVAAAQAEVGAVTVEDEPAQKPAVSPGEKQEPKPAEPPAASGPVAQRLAAYDRQIASARERAQDKLRELEEHKRKFGENPVNATTKASRRRLETLHRRAEAEVERLQRLRERVQTGGVNADSYFPVRK